MTAPTPHPLASADLADAHRWMTPCGSHDYGLAEHDCACPPGDPRNVIAQLVQEVEDWREMFGRGRLVPPDGDTRTEWGTRLAAHGGFAEEFDRSFDGAGSTEEERARRRGAAWSRRFGAEHVDVMHRTVWVGPWLPVPTTEGPPDA